MKALIGGVWHGNLADTAANRARLATSTDTFRGWVRPGSAEFPPEPGRYHLYVSYACPWAHRTVIYRRLKRLQHVVSMSVLHPRWAGPHGWRFDPGSLGTRDHGGNRRFLYEVYRAAKPDFTGRVSVPVLWDRKRSTIVNNESGDIIRMLDASFDAWGDPNVCFYPETLRTPIDAVNARILSDVCAGVYRAGFARGQAAYDEAVRRLFACLDALEERLGKQPYLCGDRVTESDWHLFATLCRFDVAYVGALRCNLRRIVDYRALSAYARRMHNLPGVAETVRLDHVKLHYYDAIDEIQPWIVPLGPGVDYRSAGTVLSADSMAA